MILALLISTAGISQAAISACATSATGSTLDTFGATALGNGCASVNLSFENLGISGATGNGGGDGYTPPTTTNTAIFATSTAFSGNAITPITLTYNPVTAADWDDTAGGASSLTATFTGAVTANSSGSYTGGSYTQPLAGFAWVFNTLTLAASGDVANTAGNSIAIQQTICLNTTTFSAGCANRAVLQANFAAGTTSPTLSCTIQAGTLGSCSSTTLNLANGLNVTSLAYSTAVTVTRVVNGGLVDLNSFSNTFNQTAVTPEPSTFGLLGFAFIGLGAYSRRRK